MTASCNMSTMEEKKDGAGRGKQKRYKTGRNQRKNVNQAELTRAHRRIKMRKGERKKRREKGRKEGRKGSEIEGILV